MTKMQDNVVRENIPEHLVINALESAILVVDPVGCVVFVNGAAEQLFQVSKKHLLDSSIYNILPPGSNISNLIKGALKKIAGVMEHSLVLESPKVKRQIVDIQISPLDNLSQCIVINIFQRRIADKLGKQQSYLASARSISALSQVLAHEIKNPLSGIRGAAQLLEEGLNSDGRKLTSLICNETDRVVALLDKMDMFSDTSEINISSVNIHKVLTRVRDISAAGFGSNKKIIESFDPSLPPVAGNFDQLVQVFLNLFKNAVEAAPKTGGEIKVSTNYQHGARLSLVSSDDQTVLPLLVEIEDNGEGVPEHIQQNLFDAFVTTKSGGGGLGLAVTAKIVAAHGGSIEFDTEPGRTIFRVFLPTFIN